MEAKYFLFVILSLFFGTFGLGLLGWLQIAPKLKIKSQQKGQLSKYHMWRQKTAVELQN